MSRVDEHVFLLDVDNTLLDNDRFQHDLMVHVSSELGAENREQYRAIIEELRTELSYVDYLGALQRLRLMHMHEPRLLLMSAFILDYPFSDLLFPGALAVLRHLGTQGPTVILSDGDIVLQPRKIQRSGLWDAVQGRVLIYVHKEEMLDAVAQQYPARHYVMIDDKLRVLAAMKQQWQTQLTTVFPRQGHYAHDPHNVRTYPPADMMVEHIGDLANQNFACAATDSNPDAQR